jgi:chemotaxis protein CheD
MPHAHPIEPATPGRFYCRQFGTPAAKVLPGEFCIAEDDIALVTVLGSCVSACIRDVRLGIGGMNHFMLPDHGRSDNPLSETARYGVYAMEILINELIKRGAKRSRLEAKVFGGGNVIAGMKHANIGHRNSDFVLAFLKNDGVAVAAHDLREEFPRKVYYFPRTGRALVKKLHRGFDLVARHESDYRARMRNTHMEGDIELFD